MVLRSALALALVLSLSGCQDKGKVTTEENLVSAGSPGVGDFEAIHILPQSAELSAGRSVTFEVLGLLPYGNSQILNDLGTWSIEGSTLIEMTEGKDGRIRALKAGQAQVSFTLEGLTKTAAITVADKTLDQLKLSVDAVDLDVENIAGTVIPTAFKVVLQGLYSDGTVEDLSADGEWTCPDAALVACDGSGNFRALGLGTTEIQVSVLDLKAKFPVSVVTHDATFSGFEVSPSPLVLERNTPETFTVTARFSNGESLDITPSAVLSWSSPALVDIQGVTSKTASGVMVGSGTLGISWAGEQTNLPFRVIDPLASRLVIESPVQSFQIPKGETERFYAKLRYNDGSEDDVSSLVAFESSDTSVMSVEPSAVYGTFRASKVGSLVLRAELGSMSAQEIVTVASARITAIELSSATSGTLPLNVSRTFVAKARMSDNSAPIITTTTDWIVESLGGQGSVSSAGVFLGTAVGAVRLRANYQGASSYVDITVGPAVPVLIEVLPRPGSGSTLSVSRAGGNVQLSAEVTYTDGTVLDQTNAVSWTYVIVGTGYSFAGYVKDNAGEKGLLVPLATGTFKAEAKLDGITGFRVIGVTP